MVLYISFANWLWNSLINKLSFFLFYLHVILCIVVLRKNWNLFNTGFQIARLILCIYFMIFQNFIRFLMCPLNRNSIQFWVHFRDELGGEGGQICVLLMPPTIHVLLHFWEEIFEMCTFDTSNFFEKFPRQFVKFPNFFKNRKITIVFEPKFVQNH